MFFAQTLRRKLDLDYKRYSNKNNDCLFPYKFSKNNDKTLLAELKTDNPKFTHNQLKNMSKREYLRNFSKKNLIKKWNRKCRVSYGFTTNKFSNKMNKTTLEAKKYVKNLVDKDIFEKKIPRWNISTKLNDNSSFINIKDYLKIIKYEAEHCFKSQISTIQLNQIYNNENIVIHDDVNNGWNLCSKLEQKEKEIIDKELYIKSLSNTQKHWLKKNNYVNNIGDKILLGIKNNKKINQNKSAFIENNTKKLINLTDEQKKIKLFEENKNDSNIDVKKIPNLKTLKKNNSCDYLIKNNNAELSEILQNRKLQNLWKDKELSEKIKLIEDLSEQSIYYEMNKTYRFDDLKKEMLEKLIYNKDRIKEEQEKIKQEKKTNLIRNMKVSKNKRIMSSLNSSKYPMSEKQKSCMENKKGFLDEYKEIDNDENKTFIEAYKKIIIEQKNKNKNKNLKRCLSSKNIERHLGQIKYFHPGIYREFNYRINSNDNADLNDTEIKEEKYKAWSCCNNLDKNSKGCEKKYIKFDNDSEIILP